VPYNVLVVDDNRIMREMVARTVRMSALDVGEVHFANNGEEALAALANTWIDLVLLDINMPVMNGEQFLARLRSDMALRSTLVVVVSTESSQPRIARLKALGAGFVHKPFRPEDLATTVDALIANSTQSGQRTT
jgi:two-component system chemotaxis response regulator CheY